MILVHVPDADSFVPDAAHSAMLFPAARTIPAARMIPAARKKMNGGGGRGGSSGGFGIIQVAQAVDS